MNRPTSTTPCVAIGVPCYGKIHHQFVDALVRLTHVLRDRGVSTGLVFSDEPGLMSTRNTLAHEFLDDATMTHLLFIDADVKFDAAQIVKWFTADLDVVTALVAYKALDHGASSAPAWPREVRGGYTKAALAPTGLMLIRRSVFERLEPTVTKYVEGPGRTVCDFFKNEYEVQGDPDLVQCPPQPAGTGTPPGAVKYLGEDLSFVRRVQKAGMSVWIDPDVHTSHFGTFEFFVPPHVREAYR